MINTLINIGEYKISETNFVSLAKLDAAVKDGVYSKDLLIEKIKNTIKHEFNDRSLITVSKELSRSMKPKDLAALKDEMFANLRDCADYRAMTDFLTKQTN